MNRIEESRRDVERQLVAIRQTMDRDVGRFPVAAKWTLPLAALSLGLLFAQKVRRSRRDRS